MRAVIVSAFGEPVVTDLAEALSDAPAGRHGLSIVPSWTAGSLVTCSTPGRGWMPRPAWSTFWCSRAGSDQGFTAPSVRIPRDAFQVVTLPSYEPWMTGALVYAETFWALDCVGLRDPTA